MTGIITRGLAATALVALTFTGSNAPANAKKHHDHDPIVQTDQGAKSQVPTLNSHKGGGGGGGGGPISCRAGGSMKCN